MKLKAILPMAALVAASTLLPGCSTADPCAGIPTPDQAAIDLINSNPRYEVEYAKSDSIDCELQPDGTWGKEAE